MQQYADIYSLQSSFAANKYLHIAYILLVVIRTFDKNSLNDFLNKLSYEMWDTIFSSEDINTMFNAFLDTYLKIFHSLLTSILQLHFSQL